MPSVRNVGKRVKPVSEVGAAVHGEYGSQIRIFRADGSQLHGGSARPAGCQQQGGCIEPSIEMLAHSGQREILCGFCRIEGLV
ncbi:MAG: hypothetical protein GX446_09715 [Chthonomonadales bacterium]|nr:hypothetical protein [Chthonomonadales bacterium]